MSFKVIDYVQRKSAGMDALCDNWANTLRDEVKANAQWKDRTAHARQAIHGGVEGGNNEYTIYTSHGVEYGEYLEEGTGIYGPKEKPFKVTTKNGKSYWHNGMKSFHTIQNTMLNSKERIRNTVIEWWSD